jgi:hypothetical protein
MKKGKSCAYESEKKRSKKIKKAQDPRYEVDDLVYVKFTQIKVPQQ